VVLVDRHIVGDPIQPGSEGNLRFKGFKFLERFKKDILCVIFRIVAVVKKLQSHIEDTRLMARYDLAVGLDTTLEDAVY
jgi:hypothetical protein